MSEKHETSALPAVVESIRSLADSFTQLETQVVEVIRSSNDPELEDILGAVRRIGKRIELFFLSILDILRRPESSPQHRFAGEFFLNNFSTISENAHTSRSIMDYVLGRLEWFRTHAARILESLKNLYATLIALQIDCETWYRALHGRGLGLHFGSEQTSAEQPGRIVLTIEKAYTLLGLQPGVTREEVKSAFRKIAKKLHPDLNPGADGAAFIEAEEAYRRILSGLVQEKV